ncbi:MAG: serine acetyltransferase [Bacteroidales bacterium]|nr:serine acetyltransferase [Bacteroidales bacterium]
MNYLQQLIKKLNRIDSTYPFIQKCSSGIFPQWKEVDEFVSTCKQILFPTYFSTDIVKSVALNDFLLSKLLEAKSNLMVLLKKSFCYGCDDHGLNNDEYDEKLFSKLLMEVEVFLDSLPTIKEMLITDAHATFLGDPAAKNHGEVILCYPGFLAMMHYRIAHQLYVQNVPILPRMMTELAHSKTGIDIHPGATIGPYFAMDHGTGIVIGETTIIGENVKIYQGVTLGAKSFPLDENGNPVKGIPRHPIVEDNVIIYANATILGRVRIGQNSIIGGNTWITTDVPPNSKVTI